MNLVDLFNFQGSYARENHKYSLKFRIPRPEKAWELFEENSVYCESAKLDEALIDRVVQFFESGDFIQMYCPEDDYELVEEISESIVGYQESKKTGNDLLGVWALTRIEREIEINWNVPNWLKEVCTIEIEDFEALYNVLRDWYIDSGILK